MTHMIDTAHCGTASTGRFQFWEAYCCACKFQKRHRSFHFPKIWCTSCRRFRPSQQRGPLKLGQSKRATEVLPSTFARNVSLSPTCSVVHSADSTPSSRYVNPCHILSYRVPRGKTRSRLAISASHPGPVGIGLATRVHAKAEPA